MASSGSSTRNFIPMANKYDRVILLVDMDCFYCQVEERLDPSLKGKPLAVVQYNAWKGGGIIAVNYAARAKGVTRHMRGDEAKEQCPDIQLVKVPNVREKADLTKYREAGKEVANVLKRFTPLLERASVDEAYLDITDAVNKRLQKMNEGTFILQPKELVNTYAVGFPTIGEFVTKITSNFICNPGADNDELHRIFHENDIPAVRQSNIRLLIGASIASEIRNAVKLETSYECSAGIAHNKILAKLACGINKPNKQTILPLHEISALFETLPLGKIKGLGAKFGEEVCERLNIRYIGELLKFTEAELQRKFDDKNGTWLYNICRGIELEAVTPRFYSKSIGCCKKFPGRNNISGLKTLKHWLKELANEINERLEKDVIENNRRAKQMVVNYVQEFDKEDISSSRSAPLLNYDVEALADISLEIIKANTKQFFRAGSESVLNNPIKFLGISVGKFETISNSQNNIQEMFAQQASKMQKSKNNAEKQQSHNIVSVTDELNNTELDRDSRQTSPLNTLKHISKEKNIPSVKSFFFNVLKKDTQDSKTSGCLDDNRNKNSNDHAENTSKVDIDQQKDYIGSDFENNLQNSNNAIEFNTKTKVTIQKEVCSPVINNPALSETTKVVLSTQYIDVPNSSNNKLYLEPNVGNCDGLSDLICDLKSNQIEVVEFNTHSEGIANNTPKKLVNDISSKSQNTTTDPSDASTSHAVLQPNNQVGNPKRKFSEIESNNVQTDYRLQYAEFATPELRPEYLQFTSCPKCGLKVFNEPNSIQTHNDLHLAQELSQQQRNEFRNEVRTKMCSAKSPQSSQKNKKSKKGSTTAVKKSSFNANITKFLKPQLEASTESAFTMNSSQGIENNNTSIKICDLCKIPIKIEDILEHNDFHVAKDLQRQLNQLEVHTVSVVKKQTSETARKSLNSSVNTSPQTNLKIKPITEFFNQYNSKT
ncbi:hypothetical protein DOY81_005320 [Sarcophaga bullata]|nr:hypothetical protein DOY81_005320 [Sarcophaga bullata]